MNAQLAEDRDLEAIAIGLEEVLHEDHLAQLVPSEADQRDPRAARDDALVQLDLAEGGARDELG